MNHTEDSALNFQVPG